MKQDSVDRFELQKTTENPPGEVFFALHGKGIYMTNPRLQRTSGPLAGSASAEGLATDTNGTLYAALYDGSNSSIVTYSPPYTGGPTTLISNVTNGASSVAVSTTGVVAVFGNSTVSLYAPGASAPCLRFHNENTLSAVGPGSFEKNGALVFLSSDDQDVPNVYEIPSGCKSLHYILLTTDDLQEPIDLHVAANGDIAIFDLYYGAIDVYSAPVGRTLGGSYNQVSITASNGVFAFSTEGTYAYTSVNGEAIAVPYPSGGSATYSVRLKGRSVQTDAIAVTPVEVPAN